MFSQRPPQTKKIKDDCWACSKPVYEGESAVCHLGVWLHADCYHSETVSPESANPAHEDPAE
jgi:hypothetical protein